jgi:excisionase family DNA binding protein
VLTAGSARADAESAKKRRKIAIIGTNPNMNEPGARTTFDELPEIVTIEDAAAFLRIERHLLFRLISQKEFPAIRVGHSWRITKWALRGWLNLNAEAAA